MIDVFQGVSRIMTIVLRIVALVLVLIVGTLALSSQAEAGSAKPDSLSIRGDDARAVELAPRPQKANS